MQTTVSLIWSYTWRFALYCTVMGGMFGAAFGMFVLSGTPEARSGLPFGALFGGGFGIVMGIGTGITLGIVTRLFFHEHVTPGYRRTMVICAFATAFVVGAFAIKLVLFGAGPANDWGFLALLSSAGGIGAAIASYRISGHIQRGLPEAQR